MKLLKKYFPELKKIDGITMLSGKPYINHPGLLYLAQGKIHSKTTRMLDISNVEKGDFYFECTIVTTDGRTFNGHGNGNSKNIKGVAKDRAFEMAEVRAQNRALREMLALGDTTAEEIDEGAALHGDADAASHRFRCGRLRRGARRPGDRRWHVARTSGAGSRRTGRGRQYPDAASGERLLAPALPVLSCIQLR